MFTKFAVAAVALAAAVAMTAPAEAKTHISIGLGFGGGYGGYGYGGPYDDDYYYPAYGGGYGYGGGGVSCGKARNIVRSNGFHNVVAIDCGGDIMRFQGIRYGDWYRIKVNRWGTIVSVNHL